MADHTHIEWTDATWNPITGCSVVSAGCKHCYAMKLAGTRLQHHRSRAGLTVETQAGPVWTGEVRFNEEWLDQPIRWKRPRRIFVCAHGDLFHENVPDEWIDNVFEIMARAPQHQFQVLTKRPERMARYFAGMAESELRDRVKYDALAETLEWPLPNVWLGVSVENQAVAEQRIPLLLQTPAAVRWLSAEPLLGDLDLTNRGFLREHRNDDGEVLHGLARIDWVVVGGESGAGARAMHPEWARSLRDQCFDAGVAFLFKQWGEWADAFYCVGGQWPISAWSDGAISARVGKKLAGRLLDGEQHDGYPEPRA
ncbi:phage Gp37/Gp68 family protein [Lysobacter sp. CA199]|uniref:phage Gp37/Gp68 family protein n=1 Tax=Lysobacter sp. CA199 TaxID=3455608 RepID=UPI003F8D19B4